MTYYSDSEHWREYITEYFKNEMKHLNIKIEKLINYNSYIFAVCIPQSK